MFLIFLTTVLVFARAQDLDGGKLVEPIIFFKQQNQAPFRGTRRFFHQKLVTLVFNEAAILRPLCQKQN